MGGGGGGGGGQKKSKVKLKNKQYRAIGDRMMEVHRTELCTL